MNLLEHIADQLERIYDGDAWHGDAIKPILHGVDSQKANRKPIPNAHSIWEIVNHTAAWQNTVMTCLQGEAYHNLDGEEDWPPIEETSEEAWQTALKALEEATYSLKSSILNFSETRLHENVPSKNFTFYVLLHGVIQHNLYHAGQIALLKKANP